MEWDEQRFDDATFFLREGGKRRVAWLIGGCAKGCVAHHDTFVTTVTTVICVHLPYSFAITHKFLFSKMCIMKSFQPQPQNNGRPGHIDVAIG